MKVRNGFVSNSSSSSFIISLGYITARQLTKIENHIEEGQRLEIDCADLDNRWSISVGDRTVEGRTSMDNFSMRDFLRQIGVPDDVIEWEGDDY
jgi:hypothetical protein